LNLLDKFIKHPVRRRGRERRRYFILISFN